MASKADCMESESSSSSSEVWTMATSSAVSPDQYSLHDATSLMFKADEQNTSSVSVDFENATFDSRNWEKVSEHQQYSRTSASEQVITKMSCNSEGTVNEKVEFQEQEIDHGCEKNVTGIIEQNLKTKRQEAREWSFSTRVETQTVLKSSHVVLAKNVKNFATSKFEGHAKSENVFASGFDKRSSIEVLKSDSKSLNSLESSSINAAIKSTETNTHLKVGSSLSDLKGISEYISTDDSTPLSNQVVTATEQTLRSLADVKLKNSFELETETQFYESIGSESRGGAYPVSVAENVRRVSDEIKENEPLSETDNSEITRSKSKVVHSFGISSTDVSSFLRNVDVNKIGVQSEESDSNQESNPHSTETANSSRNVNFEVPFTTEPVKSDMQHTTNVRKSSSTVTSTKVISKTTEKFTKRRSNPGAIFAWEDAGKVNETENEIQVSINLERSHIEPKAEQNSSFMSVPELPKSRASTAKSSGFHEEFSIGTEFETEMEKLNTLPENEVLSKSFYQKHILFDNIYPRPVEGTIVTCQKEAHKTKFSEMKTSKSNLPFTAKVQDLPGLKIEVTKHDGSTRKAGELHFSTSPMSDSNTQDASKSNVNLLELETSKLDWQKILVKEMHVPDLHSVFSSVNTGKHLQVAKAHVCIKLGNEMLANVTDIQDPKLQELITVTEDAKSSGTMKTAIQLEMEVSGDEKEHLVPDALLSTNITVPYSKVSKIQRCERVPTQDCERLKSVKIMNDPELESGIDDFDSVLAFSNSINTAIKNPDVTCRNVDNHLLSCTKLLPGFKSQKIGFAQPKLKELKIKEPRSLIALEIDEVQTCLSGETEVRENVKVASQINNCVQKMPLDMWTCTGSSESSCSAIECTMFSRPFLPRELSCCTVRNSSNCRYNTTYYHKIDQTFSETFEVFEISFVPKSEFIVLEESISFLPQSDERQNSTQGSFSTNIKSAMQVLTPNIQESSAKFSKVQPCFPMPIQENLGEPSLKDLNWAYIEPINKKLSSEELSSMICENRGIVSSDSAVEESGDPESEKKRLSRLHDYRTGTSHFGPMHEKDGNLNMVPVAEVKCGKLDFSSKVSSESPSKIIHADASDQTSRCLTVLYPTNHKPSLPQEMSDYSIENPASSGTNAICDQVVDFINLESVESCEDYVEFEFEPIVLVENMQLPDRAERLPSTKHLRSMNFGVASELKFHVPTEESSKTGCYDPIPNPNFHIQLPKDQRPKDLEKPGAEAGITGMKSAADPAAAWLSVKKEETCLAPESGSLYTTCSKMLPNFTRYRTGFCESVPHVEKFVNLSSMPAVEIVVEAVRFRNEAYVLSCLESPLQIKENRQGSQQLQIPEQCPTSGVQCALSFEPSLPQNMGSFNCIKANYEIINRVIFRRSELLNPEPAEYPENIEPVMPELIILEENFPSISETNPNCLESVNLGVNCAQTTKLRASTMLVENSDKKAPNLIANDAEFKMPQGRDHTRLSFIESISRSEPTVPKRLTRCCATKLNPKRGEDIPGIHRCSRSLDFNEGFECCEKFIDNISELVTLEESVTGSPRASEIVSTSVESKNCQGKIIAQEIKSPRFDCSCNAPVPGQPDLSQVAKSLSVSSFDYLEVEAISNLECEKSEFASNSDPLCSANAVNRRISGESSEKFNNSFFLSPEIGAPLTKISRTNRCHYADNNIPQLPKSLRNSEIEIARASEQSCSLNEGIGQFEISNSTESENEQLLQNIPVKTKSTDFLISVPKFVPGSKFFRTNEANVKKNISVTSPPDLITNETIEPNLPVLSDEAYQRNDLEIITPSVSSSNLICTSCTYFESVASTKPDFPSKLFDSSVRRATALFSEKEFYSCLKINAKDLENVDSCLENEFGSNACENERSILFTSFESARSTAMKATDTIEVKEIFGPRLDSILTSELPERFSEAIKSAVKLCETLVEAAVMNDVLVENTYQNDFDDIETQCCASIAGSQICEVLYDDVTNNTILSPSFEVPSTKIFNSAFSRHSVPDNSKYTKLTEIADVTLERLIPELEKDCVPVVPTSFRGICFSKKSSPISSELTAVLIDEPSLPVAFISSQRPSFIGYVSKIDSIGLTSVISNDLINMIASRENVTQELDQFVLEGSLHHEPCLAISSVSHEHICDPLILVKEIESPSLHVVVQISPDSVDKYSVVVCKADVNFSLAEFEKVSNVPITGGDCCSEVKVCLCFEVSVINPSLCISEQASQQVKPEQEIIIVTKMEPRVPCSTAGKAVRVKVDRKFKQTKRFDGQCSSVGVCQKRGEMTFCDIETSLPLMESISTDKLDEDVKSVNITGVKLSQILKTFHICNCVVLPTVSNQSQATLPFSYEKETTLNLGDPAELAEAISEMEIGIASQDTFNTADNWMISKEIKMATLPEIFSSNNGPGHQLLQCTECHVPHMLKSKILPNYAFESTEQEGQNEKILKVSKRDTALTDESRECVAKSGNIFASVSNPRSSNVASLNFANQRHTCLLESSISLEKCQDNAIVPLDGNDSCVIGAKLERPITLVQSFEENKIRCDGAMASVSCKTSDVQIPSKIRSYRIFDPKICSNEKVSMITAHDADPNFVTAIDCSDQNKNSVKVSCANLQKSNQSSSATVQSLVISEDNKIAKLHKFCYDNSERHPEISKCFFSNSVPKTYQATGMNAHVLEIADKFASGASVSSATAVRNGFEAQRENITDQLLTSCLLSAGNSPRSHGITSMKRANEAQNRSLNSAISLEEQVDIENCGIVETEHQLVHATSNLSKVQNKIDGTDLRHQDDSQISSVSQKIRLNPSMIKTTRHISTEPPALCQSTYSFKSTPILKQLQYTFEKANIDQSPSSINLVSSNSLVDSLPFSSSSPNSYCNLTDIIVPPFHPHFNSQNLALASTVNSTTYNAIKTVSSNLETQEEIENDENPIYIDLHSSEFGDDVTIKTKVMLTYSNSFELIVIRKPALTNYFNDVLVVFPETESTSSFEKTKPLLIPIESVQNLQTVPSETTFVAELHNVLLSKTETGLIETKIKVKEIDLPRPLNSLLMSSNNNLMLSYSKPEISDSSCEPLQKVIVFSDQRSNLNPVDAEFKSCFITRELIIDSQENLKPGGFVQSINQQPHILRKKHEFLVGWSGDKIAMQEKRQCKKIEFRIESVQIVGGVDFEQKTETIVILPNESYSAAKLTEPEKEFDLGRNEPQIDVTLRSERKNLNYSKTMTEDSIVVTEREPCLKVKNSSEPEKITYDSSSEPQPIFRIDEYSETEDNVSNPRIFLNCAWSVMPDNFLDDGESPSNLLIPNTVSSKSGPEFDSIHTICDSGFVSLNSNVSDVISLHRDVCQGTLEVSSDNKTESGKNFDNCDDKNDEINNLQISNNQANTQISNLETKCSKSDEIRTSFFSNQTKQQRSNFETENMLAVQGSRRNVSTGISFGINSTSEFQNSDRSGKQFEPNTQTNPHFQMAGSAFTSVPSYYQSICEPEFSKWQSNRKYKSEPLLPRDDSDSESGEEGKYVETASVSSGQLSSFLEFASIDFREQVTTDITEPVSVSATDEVQRKDSDFNMRGSGNRDKFEKDGEIIVEIIKRQKSSEEQSSPLTESMPNQERIIVQARSNEMDNNRKLHQCEVHQKEKSAVLEQISGSLLDTAKVKMTDFSDAENSECTETRIISLEIEVPVASKSKIPGEPNNFTPCTAKKSDSDLVFKCRTEFLTSLQEIEFNAVLTLDAGEKAEVIEIIPIEIENPMQNVSQEWEHELLNLESEPQTPNVQRLLDQTVDSLTTEFASDCSVNKSDACEIESDSPVEMSVVIANEVQRLGYEVATGSFAVEMLNSRSERSLLEINSATVDNLTDKYDDVSTGTAVTTEAPQSRAVSESETHRKDTVEQKQKVEKQAESVLMKNSENHLYASEEHELIKLGKVDTEFSPKEPSFTDFDACSSDYSNHFVCSNVVDISSSSVQSSQSEFDQKSVESTVETTVQGASKDTEDKDHQGLTQPSLACREPRDGSSKVEPDGSSNSSSQLSSFVDLHSIDFNDAQNSGNISLNFDADHHENNKLPQECSAETMPVDESRLKTDTVSADEQELAVKIPDVEVNPALPDVEVNSEQAKSQGGNLIKLSQNIALSIKVAEVTSAIASEVPNTSEKLEELDVNRKSIIETFDDRIISMAIVQPNEPNCVKQLKTASIRGPCEITMTKGKRTEFSQVDRMRTALTSVTVTKADEHLIYEVALQSVEQMETVDQKNITVNETAISKDFVTSESAEEQETSMMNVSESTPCESVPDSYNSSSYKPRRNSSIVEDEEHKNLPEPLPRAHEESSSSASMEPDASSFSSTPLGSFVNILSIDFRDEQKSTNDRLNLGDDSPKNENVPTEWKEEATPIVESRLKSKSLLLKDNEETRLTSEIEDQESVSNKFDFPDDEKNIATARLQREKNLLFTQHMSMRSKETTVVAPTSEEPAQLCGKNEESSIKSEPVMENFEDTIISMDIDQPNAPNLVEQMKCGSLRDPCEIKITNCRKFYQVCKLGTNLTSISIEVTDAHEHCFLGGALLFAELTEIVDAKKIVENEEGTSQSGNDLKKHESVEFQTSVNVESCRTTKHTKSSSQNIIPSNTRKYVELEKLHENKEALTQNRDKSEFDIYSMKFQVGDLEKEKTDSISEDQSSEQGIAADLVSEKPAEQSEGQISDARRNIVGIDDLVKSSVTTTTFVASLRESISSTEGYVSNLNTPENSTCSSKTCAINLQVTKEAEPVETPKITSFLNVAGIEEETKSSAGFAEDKPKNLKSNAERKDIVIDYQSGISKLDSDMLSNTTAKAPPRSEFNLTAEVNPDDAETSTTKSETSIILVQSESVKKSPDFHLDDDLKLFEIEMTSDGAILQPEKDSRKEVNPTLLLSDEKSGTEKSKVEMTVDSARAESFNCTQKDTRKNVETNESESHIPFTLESNDKSNRSPTSFSDIVSDRIGKELDLESNRSIDAKNVQSSEERALMSKMQSTVNARSNEYSKHQVKTLSLTTWKMKEADANETSEIKSSQNRLVMLQSELSCDNEEDWSSADFDEDEPSAKKPNDLIEITVPDEYEVSDRDSSKERNVTKVSSTIETISTCKTNSSEAKKDKQKSVISAFQIDSKKYLRPKDEQEPFESENFSDVTMKKERTCTERRSTACLTAGKRSQTKTCNQGIKIDSAQSENFDWADKDGRTGQVREAESIPVYSESANPENDGSEKLVSLEEENKKSVDFDEDEPSARKPNDLIKNTVSDCETEVSDRDSSKQRNVTKVPTRTETISTEKRNSSTAKKDKHKSVISALQVDSVKDLRLQDEQEPFESENSSDVTMKKERNCTERRSTACLTARKRSQTKTSNQDMKSNSTQSENFDWADKEGWTREVRESESILVYSDSDNTENDISEKFVSIEEKNKTAADFDENEPSARKPNDLIKNTVSDDESEVSDRDSSKQQNVTKVPTRTETISTEKRNSSKAKKDKPKSVISALQIDSKKDLRVKDALEPFESENSSDVTMKKERNCTERRSKACLTAGKRSQTKTCNQGIKIDSAQSENFDWADKDGRTGQVREAESIPVYSESANPENDGSEKLVSLEEENKKSVDFDEDEPSARKPNDLIKNTVSDCETEVSDRDSSKQRNVTKVPTRTETISTEKRNSSTAKKDKHKSVISALQVDSVKDLRLQDEQEPFESENSSDVTMKKERNCTERRSTACLTARKRSQTKTSNQDMKSNSTQSENFDWADKEGWTREVRESESILVYSDSDNTENDISEKFVSIEEKNKTAADFDENEPSARKPNDLIKNTVSDDESEVSDRDSSKQQNVTKVPTRTETISTEKRNSSKAKKDKPKSVISALQIDSKKDLRVKDALEPFESENSSDVTMKKERNCTERRSKACLTASKSSQTKSSNQGMKSDSAQSENFDWADKDGQTGEVRKPDSIPVYTESANPENDDSFADVVIESFGKKSDWDAKQKTENTNVTSSDERSSVSNKQLSLNLSCRESQCYDDHLITEVEGEIPAINLLAAESVDLCSTVKTTAEWEPVKRKGITSDELSQQRTENDYICENQVSVEQNMKKASKYFDIKNQSGNTHLTLLQPEQTNSCVEPENSRMEVNVTKETVEGKIESTKGTKGKKRKISDIIEKQSVTDIDASSLNRVSVAVTKTRKKQRNKTEGLISVSCGLEGFVDSEAKRNRSERQSITGILDGSIEKSVSAEMSRNEEFILQQVVIISLEIEVPTYPLCEEPLKTTLRCTGKASKCQSQELPLKTITALNKPVERFVISLGDSVQCCRVLTQIYPEEEFFEIEGKMNSVHRKTECSEEKLVKSGKQPAVKTSCSENELKDKNYPTTLPIDAGIELVLKIPKTSVDSSKETVLMDQIDSVKSKSECQKMDKQQTPFEFSHQKCAADGELQTPTEEFYRLREFNQDGNSLNMRFPHVPISSSSLVEPVTSERQKSEMPDSPRSLSVQMDGNSSNSLVDGFAELNKITQTSFPSITTSSSQDSFNLSDYKLNFSLLSTDMDHQNPAMNSFSSNDCADNFEMNSSPFESLRPNEQFTSILPNFQSSPMKNPKIEVRIESKKHLDEKDRFDERTGEIVVMETWLKSGVILSPPMKPIWNAENSNQLGHSVLACTHQTETIKFESANFLPDDNSFHKSVKICEDYVDISEDPGSENLEDRESMPYPGSSTESSDRNSIVTALKRLELRRQESRASYSRRRSLKWQFTTDELSNVIQRDRTSEGNNLDANKNSNGESGYTSENEIAIGLLRLNPARYTNEREQRINQDDFFMDDELYENRGIDINRIRQKRNDIHPLVANLVLEKEADAGIISIEQSSERSNTRCRVLISCFRKLWKLLLILFLILLLIYLFSEDCFVSFSCIKSDTFFHLDHSNEKPT